MRVLLSAFVIWLALICKAARMSLVLDSRGDVLIACTVEGNIYGISDLDGQILWKLKSEPLVSRHENAGTTGDENRRDKQATSKELITSDSTHENEIKWLVEPVGPGYLYLQSPKIPIQVEILYQLCLGINLATF